MYLKMVSRCILDRVVTGVQAMFFLVVKTIPDHQMSALRREIGIVSHLYSASETVPTCSDAHVIP